MTRRGVLTASAAAALGPAPALGRDVSATPLHALAAGRGLSFGTAVNTNVLTDPSYAALVARECNVIVAENHFKWGMLRPTPAQADFSVADQIVAFGQSHGMRVRGHTLFFQEALSAWVPQEIARTSAERVLEDHIRLVCGHFGRGVSSWDVMNEVVLPEDGRPDGLRRNVFLEAMGPSYVGKAFWIAREAAPGAELVYNDWIGPYAGRYFETRRARLLQLLEGLVRSGAPVQAFGVQSHLDASRDDVDERGWAAFLQRASDLGLRLHLTELDVADQKLPADPGTRDRKTADAVRRYLDVTLDNKAVRDLLTWNLSDRYTAVSIYLPRPDGLPPRSLPYGDGDRPKPMREAIAQALVAAPAR
ncbi:endo-1,4-beta-xylanase [Salinarimonas soli]|nr:endo-1,4-beta-xylanase [Salinarimonas soli]